jgi:dienelactone hydrolase
VTGWLAAALLVAGLLLAASGPELDRRRVVVAGVPLDEAHPPAAAGRRPGVVVAHGFAGSARLMAPFGDTLAAHGYVVVLPDLAGHGANTARLTDAALQHDLDVAVAHLRTRPDVDPSRIAVVGHSMGAGAVTRYAATHPEIATTVAISLPASADALPQRLLALVGAAEFAGFCRAAARAETSVVIPGADHVGVLYASRTHRETVAWLDATFGRPAGATRHPLPARRPAATVLLLLAFAVGLHPLTRLPRRTRTPAAPPDPPLSPTTQPAAAATGAPDPAGAAADEGTGPARPAGAAPDVAPGPAHPRRRIGRLAAVAFGAATAAALMAPLLPTARLPLASGGFVVGFTLLMGLVMLVLHRAPDRRVTGSRRHLATAPLLLAYAAAAIFVPLHLGLTHAVPVGPRWWLLLCVWAGFAVLAFAAGPDILAVSAVALLGMTAAALTGLTSGFLLLVVPLLAALLLWQAAWASLLRRTATPPWLIALTGSLVVAWPIATTLPLT